MNKIIIKNINKSYQLVDKKLDVLQNLSLEIPTDKISVILGRSGCGKTTLLRILSFLEQQDSGQIEYPHQFNSSYVFQEHRLMPWLSVKENISFAYEKDEIDETKLTKLIDMVKLRDFVDAYPSQLSGGMKQRVALARALLVEPDLIYMDEPFASLDYFTRVNMQRELIKLYQQHNYGILFVTHNIDEALMLAHQIIVLDDGYIKEVISLDDHLDNRDILAQSYIQLKKDLLNKLDKKEY